MAITSPSIRRMVYSPVAATGPFPIDFPVYDDTGADLEVRLNGAVVGGWTFSGTVESGFYGKPNTWVDGSITFAAQVTGSLVIDGMRAPRRQVAFQEGRGVPARDLNAELDMLTAAGQELRRDVDAVDARVVAADEVFAARDEVRARLLGSFDHFPTEAELGFAFEDGSQAFIHSQPDPLNDGMYVWQGGQWYPATDRPQAYGRSVVVFVDAGIVATGVVPVPGGYVVGLVDVLRKGVDMVIGPAPGLGATDPDCSASDGTTLVFPAGVLQLNEPIKIVRRKPTSIANVHAVDVSYGASNVDAALTAKAPIDSPSFTNTPTAPTPAAGNNSTRLATTAYVQNELAGYISPGQVLVASGALASAQAVLDIPLTGGYREYKLRIPYMEPVSSGSPLIRISTDGGSTFIATGYRFAGRYTADNNTGADIATGAGSGVSLTAVAQAAAAGLPGDFEITLTVPPVNGRETSIGVVGRTVNTGSITIHTALSGRRSGTTIRPTHVRIVYDSGNIATGAQWQLYGQRN